ncbi:unnamed protein product [Spodoptera exigua]|nr:unnamed protein product [Spodoptera exigua]
MLVKLPPRIDMETTERMMGPEIVMPMCVSLLQEIGYFNMLINIIVSGLKELRRAIEGLVVMSEMLETMYTCIFEGRTPEFWLRGRPSMKPLGAWCRELYQRGAHLGGWAAAPRAPPTLCWLPAFVAPTGFLTAVMQVPHTPYPHHTTLPPHAVLAARLRRPHRLPHRRHAGPTHTIPSPHHTPPPRCAGCPPSSPPPASSPPSCRSHTHHTLTTPHSPPTLCWLPAFVAPTGFLTAVMQVPHTPYPHHTTLPPHAVLAARLRRPHRLPHRRHAGPTHTIPSPHHTPPPRCAGCPPSSPPPASSPPSCRSHTHHTNFKSQQESYS